MSNSSSFVFLDRKKNRWKKVKSGFQATTAIVAFLVLLLGPFSIPRFDSSHLGLADKTPKEIIDAISTKKKETIEVEGNGPTVSLKNENGKFSLSRNDFQEEKLVVLTFDDGPDPTFTPEILNILDREKVPAIFFVAGNQAFRYPDLTEEIVKRGYQIGVHTFSHTPEDVDLYTNQKRVQFELDFSQKLIQAYTGFKTRIFRVPYWGTEDTISLNSLVLTIFAIDRGYTVVSSTIDSFDWQEKDKEKVITNSFRPKMSQVILMHDGGGDRNITVRALPEIIKLYQEAGFRFVTADSLMSNGQQAMPSATLVEKAQAIVAVWLFWFKTYFHTLPLPLFRLSLGVLGTVIFIILSLSSLHVIRKYKKTRNNNSLNREYLPSVSIIVPAYNEEKVIEKTLESLLASDYPNFEVIVINNNSKDKTAQLVRRFTNGKVRLLSERRQGKFAALNKGVKSANGEIIITLDADTQVLSNTIWQIIQPLQVKNVGAVAGNLMVGNVINQITAFQAIEYIVGLNLDRRAFDVLGAIPVVPGALGAWRKKALVKAGGYKPNTITEDADLTIRVQRVGYKVVFEGSAVAYTEAPQNLSAFLRQRRRWCFGMLQVLYQNKDIYFKPKSGTLGMVLLPYLAFIQLPMSLVAPIVDLVAIISLFFSPELIIAYYLVFLLLSLTLTMISLVFANDGRIWLLIFLPFTRIFYQPLWYYVLYRSVLTAIIGPIVPWAKTVHFGSVSLEEIKKPIIAIAPRLVEPAE